MFFNVKWDFGHTLMGIGNKFHADLSANDGQGIVAIMLILIHSYL